MSVASIAFQVAASANCECDVHKGHSGQAVSSSPHLKNNLEGVQRHSFVNLAPRVSVGSVKSNLDIVRLV